MQVRIANVGIVGLIAPVCTDNYSTLVSIVSYYSDLLTDNFQHPLCRLNPAQSQWRTRTWCVITFRSVNALGIPSHLAAEYVGRRCADKYFGRGERGGKWLPKHRCYLRKDNNIIVLGEEDANVAYAKLSSMLVATPSFKKSLYGVVAQSPLPQ
jgi:hypothetical protein